MSNTLVDSRLDSTAHLLTTGGEGRPSKGRGRFVTKRSSACRRDRGTVHPMQDFVSTGVPSPSPRSHPPVPPLVLSGRLGSRKCSPTPSPWGPIPDSRVALSRVPTGSR